MNAVDLSLSPTTMKELATWRRMLDKASGARRWQEVM
jgi:hypothetical protein